MGCAIVLIGAFMPRVAVVLLWIFTNLVDRAFSGFVLPLLGVIFLPYATLLYVLAWSPVGGVSGWGWFFVVLGVLCDLAHYAGGGVTSRRRYQPAT